jgi:glycerol-3-phosphate dehydrogenase
MAVTIEDILARRTRALLLDARASLQIASKVAALMAEEQGRDAKWQSEQVDSYAELVKNYI